MHALLLAALILFTAAARWFGVLGRAGRVPAGRVVNPLRLLRRFRSAITGRYVSKRYAETHPDTTVTETDR